MQFRLHMHGACDCHCSSGPFSSDQFSVLRRTLCRIAEMQRQCVSERFSDSFASMSSSALTRLPCHTNHVQESMPHTVCDGDASAAASDAASAGDEVLNTGASDGVSESHEGSCVKDVGAVDAAGDLSSVAENTVDEESAATRHRRQRGRSAGKVPADGAKTMRTMSRVYVAEMKNIAKRLVLRM